MFIGEYKHNLDTKGRLAIPSKFRDDLKGGAVVTRGLDNCLTLYTLNQWQIIADQLSKLPISNPNARAFTRLMLAGAMVVDIDKAGRIVIPQYLRKFANLSGAVVIAGLNTRIELWNEKDWQAYQEKAEGEAGDIAGKLTELGV
jgi:MraZ protein